MILFLFKKLQYIVFELVPELYSFAALCIDFVRYCFTTFFFTSIVDIYQLVRYLHPAKCFLKFFVFVLIIAATLKYKTNTGTVHRLFQFIYVVGSQVSIGVTD